MDELKEWANRRREMFISPDGSQIDEVKKILKDFPSLAKPEKFDPNADPWLIALANVKKRDITLSPTRYIIVTEESKTKQNRIPSIAGKYGIVCINLIELFKKKKWKF
ncbi:MAG: DUF4411 family protein [Archaeoglobaceae archaeon]